MIIATRRHLINAFQRVDVENLIFGATLEDNKNSKNSKIVTKVAT